MFSDNNSNNNPDTKKRKLRDSDSQNNQSQPAPKKYKSERLIDEDRVFIVKMIVDGLIKKEANTFYFDKKRVMPNTHDILKTNDGKYFAISTENMYQKKIVSNDFSNNEDSFLQMNLAQDMHSGQTYLLKKYTSNNKSCIEKIHHEIALLKKTGQLEGTAIEVKTDSTAIYVVKEYIPGKDLLKIHEQDLINDFDKKIAIAKKITEAIFDFHTKHQILHCDIKLDNIIYDDENDVVRLTDYDVSLNMNENKSASTKEIRGTPGFLAPELTEGNGEHTFNEKTEVYALGITLAEWFKLTNNLSANSNISNSSFFSKELSKTEHALLNLIKCMTDPNPDTRIKLAEVKDKLEQLSPTLGNEIKKEF